MNDYDIMIHDAMQNGSTPEEIAKAFTDALNRVNTKMAEADAREEALGDIEDAFFAHIDDEQLGEEDIGLLAALVYGSKNPDWTAEDIKRFVDSVNEQVQLGASIMSAKNINEAIDIASKSFITAFNKAADKPNGDFDKVSKFLQMLQ